MKQLWTEKYRPDTLDGYVFRDDHQRKQINTWIKDKSIPHLLLSGAAGIGKINPFEKAVCLSGAFGVFVDRNGVAVNNQHMSGCQAVHVLAPSCTLAGMLSTAALVLGPDEGLRLIESQPGAEGLLHGPQSKLSSRRFYEHVAS
jgi:hypothetical protein